MILSHAARFDASLTDRFYTALYDALLHPDLPASAKLALFLNVVYKDEPRLRRDCAEIAPRLRRDCAEIAISFSTASPLGPAAPKLGDTAAQCRRDLGAISAS